MMRVLYCHLKPARFSKSNTAPHTHTIPDTFTAPPGLTTEDEFLTTTTHNIVLYGEGRSFV